MKQHVAVITGASSGLGAEFARQLAEEGYPLVLTARREDRLQELSDEIHRTIRSDLPITRITADLSDPDECMRLLRELDHAPVGIFINNAGFGDCGKFTETDLNKDLSMIDVNIRALHILTKEILRKMDAQGGGYLLNVASSAGLIPAGPYMATYYATKAYAASLSRAAAQELKEQGSPVSVSVLCPGPVDTEFNAVANVEFALRGISAEFCVREAIKGMKRKQTVIVPSAKMKAAVFFGHFIPESLYIRLAGHQQKKKLGRTE